MAISALTATSWQDIADFLRSMKDVNNANFFTDVVLDTTTNTLKLYTTESGTDPLCILSTTGSSLELKFSNGGNPASSYSKYHYTNNAIVFPQNLYKTSWGLLWDVNEASNNHRDYFGVCKTNTGKTAVFFFVDYYSTSGLIGTASAPKSVMIHTYDDIFKSAYSSEYTHKFSCNSGNDNLSAPFTALIPIVIHSENLDYTKNTYMQIYTQSIGVYGSFSHEGHQYLTNGLISILDT